MAVVAPSGTQAKIVQRMNRELDDVLKQPEIVQRLPKIGRSSKPVAVTIDRLAPRRDRHRARLPRARRDSQRVWLTKSHRHRHRTGR